MRQRTLRFCTICTLTVLFTAAANDTWATSDTSGLAATVANDATTGEDHAKVHSQGESSLTEIVVTAQKQSERILDVPIPVAVISTEALTQTNQVNIQDYYMLVPGLTFSPDIVGAQNISIRGITTGGIASGNTTGVVLDDVPTTGGAFNFDPGDLDRIEILRGPQGTLYGNSAMGGLVKYVTKDPSPDHFEARAEAGTESIDNAHSLGYTVRGSVNLPINESVAVRMSAFTREAPGYLDNPVLHIDGINVVHASGGHFALLWKPSENFTAKLSAFYQETIAGSTSDVTTKDFNGNPVVGNLSQAYIRGAGRVDNTLQFYSATLNYKLGVVDLTSLTGYNVADVRDALDLTSIYGSFTPATFPGFAGTLEAASGIDTHFSEELRASAPLGSHVDGVLGLYYGNHRVNWAPEWSYASNPYTGEIGGLGLLFQNDGWSTVGYEHAIFGNVTFHVTQQFDIEAGAREHYFKSHSPVQIFTGTWTLPFGYPSDPYYTSAFDSYSHAFTYLFTPRYKISDDQMIYARLASGFRPGGVNIPAPPGVPPTVAPDKTLNYEIGFKGEYLDHRLSLDASVYYIDWKGLQTISVTPPPNAFTYQSNAGGAKSQGVELSAEARPLTGLRVSGWVDFSEAVLTEDYNTVAAGVVEAPKGEPLPYSARFAGNLAASQAFHLTGEMSGEAGAGVSYVGGRWDVFTFGSRQYLPAYAKTDLHVSATYRTWTTNLYVNNLTNRVGLLSGGPGNLIPFRFNYIQPRTVGLSVAKTF